MNLSDAKQKAFAQRVYFDLKICRKWSQLNVYFDEMKKRIFFLGRSAIDQPSTFVLPVSSDEQFTVDDLFTLKSQLSSTLNSNITENISSVLMAIIADDLTLAYFNFTLGLPTIINSEISLPEQTMILTIDEECIDEMKKETLTTDEWSDHVGTWD